jgi:hypothetical protein
LSHGLATWAWPRGQIVEVGLVAQHGMCPRHGHHAPGSGGGAAVGGAVALGRQGKCIGQGEGDESSPEMAGEGEGWKTGGAASVHRW